MTTAARSIRTHDVRTISHHEQAPIARLLARAFATDPVVAWSLPGEARRAEASAQAFAVILGLYLGKGHVYADAELLSTSLWAPPEDGELRTAALVRRLPRLARIYRHRLPLVLAGLARVQRRRPTEPHWYLAYLGTDPDHQGKGLAAAVLTPVLARCDRDQVPAYLEASDPDLIPFYQRHGFVVRGQVQLPAGPPVFVMVRDPQVAPAGS